VRPPLEEYAVRKRDREAASKARERTHIRLGNAKVAIFVAAVIYTAFVLAADPSPAIYASALAIFIALSIWHESVIRALARAQAAVTFYIDGIARIEDRWMRDAPSGERFRDRNHPYVDDLDVFGPSSLFQLLSLCRTPMGEAWLAGWLLHPSTVPDIRERQSRVAALRDRIDLRERIAVVNAGRRRSIHAERLIAWAEDRSSLPPLRILAAAFALAFLAVLFIYLNGGPGIYVAMVLLVNVVMLVWLGKRANALVESLSSSTEAAALDLLSNVVKEIETETFEEPAIVAMSRRLKGDAHVLSASRGITRLARIADWADSRHNVFLRLSEIPLLFTLQLAYAAESWRRAHGSRLRDWVETVGEMEALLSFAGFSYEHPSYPFPDLIDGTEPIYDATEIAHPLLPATAVSNSLVLTVQARNPTGAQDTEPKTQDPQVLIVSGSNMSGKSTLMRTVGINAVLALAGGPVRAERLRLTALSIGTCLRHTDSLQEHRSGFYTEALRIRAICDLLDAPLPVLFVFDELLSGTNSKDRRVAAEGVARTMIARGAIGMVTTHDLSLTEIAAIFPGQVKNVHLQDRVENGAMSFDYKLRDGVITHSNALELMRMIGLDV
jgi:MutS domain V/MutS domain III